MVKDFDFFWSEDTGRVILRTKIVPKDLNPINVKVISYVEIFDYYILLVMLVLL